MFRWRQANESMEEILFFVENVSTYMSKRITTTKRLCFVATLHVPSFVILHLLCTHNIPAFAFFFLTILIESVDT